MMERAKGGLERVRTHHSPFELSKFVIVHFSHNNRKRAAAPKLTISYRSQQGTTETFDVPTAESYKYLGVILTPTLTSNLQRKRVISKAITWTNLFRRIVRTTKGLQTNLARRLYITAALPKITYAADVWYTHRA
ncbi:hypothetical protein CPB86DRAFT_185971 [Serendipita vermifera]|nr:hypothetical protein CPB86DRAFT_185971 [Serendipita vermifera]